MKVYSAIVLLTLDCVFYINNGRAEPMVNQGQQTAQDLMKPPPQVLEWLKGKCLQGFTCKLPECSCQGSKIPKHLTRDVIPQLVYVTIEGKVDKAVFKRYLRMFRRRRNPNGCPARGTLFVTQTGTKIAYLQLLRRLGAEIALQGINYQNYNTSEGMEKEILSQMEIMRQYGINDISGWKSRGLELLGDAQFQILKQHGFQYDASIAMTYPRPGIHNPWPFTLDYGFHGNCVNPSECPAGKFKGFWEVPAVAMQHEGCMSSPSSSNNTVQCLRDNFLINYNSNKAPLGIHLQQEWLNSELNADNFLGLSKFITLIMSLDDVYLVSSVDIITWMRNPTTLQNITNMSPWKCF